MIHIYESFSEFAEDFVDGEKLAHRISEHTEAECLGWQKGVKEFAKWLDDAGGKMICEPGTFENLWDRATVNSPPTPAPASPDPLSAVPTPPPESP